MADKKLRETTPQYRFGIGEWYGQSFVGLTQSCRNSFAKIQFDQIGPPTPPCPFLSRSGFEEPCWKKGGVCSLRSYERDTQTGAVTLDHRGSTLRAICPSRFEQDGMIYKWIGEIVLGNPDATRVGQVNFLEKVPLIGGPQEEGAPPQEVGRIDSVLAIPHSDPLQWCAIEIQAVYFSGRKMSLHFDEMLKRSDGLPFPGHTRRPDYRSSAPKRLMPQLLIKVPTLSRWGKKMAVVVDEDFFKAMGKMDRVSDISNSDVVWFIVSFQEQAGEIRITRGEVVYTTLESSRDALIAGRPPTQAKFEEKIRARLRQAPGGPNRANAR